MPRLDEILVQKGAAQAMPGIGQQRVHRPILCLYRRVKGVDAFQCGEVSLNGGDFCPKLAKFRGGRLDLSLVGRDHQIVALLGANFCKLATYAD
jgi:hypothetical protein